MRWMRLLRRRPKPTPTHSDKPARTPGQREAESALSRAQEARQEIESWRPAVKRVTGRLARQQQMNHFAELFRSALEGGPN